VVLARSEIQRAARIPWTAADEALMCEHWPALGTVKMQQMLSVWRSEGCIQGKAKRLGLVRARRGIPYQRYPQSDLVDHQIRSAYATGKPGEIKALSARLKRNYGWIRWRALQLGCRPVKMKPPDWSDEELAILERLEGRGVRVIKNALKRAGFNRTIGAIYHRLHQIGLKYRPDEVMSLPSLAHCMGVSPEVVTRWVEKFGLKTQKSSTHYGGEHFARWVSYKDLRQFIRENVALIDIRKADKFWLIDLLAGE
jgi:hypothetical protein